MPVPIYTIKNVIKRVICLMKTRLNNVVLQLDNERVRGVRTTLFSPDFINWQQRQCMECVEIVVCNVISFSYLRI